MKPRKNAFLFGSLALAMACTAQAAQIDVVTTLAPTNTTTGSYVRGVRALTTSQTWTANNEYFLTDRVFVPNGITLTIEPGTKIYGSINDNATPTNKADDKVGSLVAARGGRIVADGTAEEPITFTAVAVWEAENNTESAFDPDAVIGVAGNPNNGMPDNNDAGLWGGLVVLGNAYVCHYNTTSDQNLGNAVIEGFVPNSTPDDEVPTDGLSDAAEYGFETSGPFARDDNDDSGVYRYITISHGGYEFETAKEINGLTLGGVGAGTVIDHIEVVANQDDGIEFFGGTVSTSHIILAYNQDDNFDFDSGYTGTMQFFFSIQNPGFADGGFEHDGIESTTGGSYDNAFTTVDVSAGNHVPQSDITLSKPRMFNGTLIGPGRTGTFTTISAGNPNSTVRTEKGNNGFIFDDYYNGETYNSVIDDFTQDLAIFIDGAKSYGATAAVGHNTLGRFGSAVITQVENARVSASTGTNMVNADGNLTVTVTGAFIAGSPKVISVPVLNGDIREVVAAKIAAAINLDADITADYYVGSSGRDVGMASKVAGLAGNDGTLNIAIAAGLNIAAVTLSTNTQAGSNTSSVTTGGSLNNLTYFSGTNVRNLFMNGSGAATGGNSAPDTDPQLTTYTRDVDTDGAGPDTATNELLAIDPRPAAGSPLLKSNGATLQSGAPVPVNYRGAFGPGDDANWAGGWTRTWASGILQGGYSTPTPPFADADSDGISDTLEGTTALTSLGFSAGVNNVSPTNLFDAIYTQSEILELRTTAGVTVQKTNAPTNNVTLTVPVEKSDTLNPGEWLPAGNMTLGPFTGDPTKEFYRLEVKGAN